MSAGITGTYKPVVAVKIVGKEMENVILANRQPFIKLLV